jgi:peptidoglycan/LPS O-acetylase OafA/YrhL
MPEPTGPGSSRRHDLDALRAAAMLLGIAYHAALSFSLGAGWIVQDVDQSKPLYILQAFVHGFRMQLFMVLSGFFTALLWRRQGLKALLWNRFRRVLLPCLAALVTLVPAVKWVGSFATKANTARRLNASQKVTPEGGLWGAIENQDFHAFAKHLKMPEALTSLHPEFHLRALSWAALVGSPQIVGALVGKGAEVNWRSAKGHTALHGAAFFGRSEVAELLIQSGADITALSLSGESPWQSASTDYSWVEYIAGYLGVTVQREQVLEGRRRILQRLEEQRALREVPGGVSARKTWKETFTRLVHTPVFSLVWFLWFLVWLLLIFSLYAVLAERFGWRLHPHRLLVSQGSLLWLVPLTGLFTWFMKSAHGEFGPDTSMGILPMPHVLAYYALFFGFGVLYFECGDATGRLGRSWRWTLPVSLLVVFPAALEFATGTFGLREHLLPTAQHRVASVVFQALYAWMMTFAGIGMFRSLLAWENEPIRYLSDASYWFYLAHLPLVLAAQAFVCQWAVPAELKFLLLCFLVGTALFWSYDRFVRYSFIGSFLNGPRRRVGTRPEPKI